MGGRVKGFVLVLGWGGPVRQRSGLRCRGGGHRPFALAALGILAPAEGLGLAIHVAFTPRSPGQAGPLSPAPSSSSSPTLNSTRPPLCYMLCILSVIIEAWYD